MASANKATSFLTSTSHVSHSETSSHADDKLNNRLITENAQCFRVNEHKYASLAVALPLIGVNSFGNIDSVRERRAFVY